MLVEEMLDEILRLREEGKSWDEIRLYLSGYIDGRCLTPNQSKAKGEQ